MSRHTARSFSWGFAAAATLTFILILTLGGITGLSIAIGALNGSLGAPTWSIGGGLLLALVAAAVTFLARIVRSQMRPRGRR